MPRHTLSVLVENKSGVLARVSALFSRRAFNIESLAVGPTENPGLSRMTIVVEAEALSTSKDWGPTAGAFKRLMQDWKRAGRASRADDDALWKRFKAAQDAFFNAKDEVVAAAEDLRELLPHERS